MLDIYVINLKERIDRWQQIEKIFGNNFNLIRIDAIKHEIGHYGCFMSHQKCLKIAKDKNLNNIIVLEDDCIISPYYNDNFVEKIINIQNFLNSFENWNIFLGACNKAVEIKVINQPIVYNNCNFVQINNSFTTHFIIYNKNCYDFFLNFNNYDNPIDTVWHNKLIALTILPFIAFQSKGFSNINGSKIDYTERFQNTEKYLLNYINQKP